eukprot:65627_1
MVSCHNPAVSDDISTIVWIGGCVYGGLYIGFLLFIFIAAVITECIDRIDARQPNRNELPLTTQNNQPHKRGKCWHCMHRLKGIGKEIMRLRAIYFVIVVHIFDTMTDFLIMLEWYIKGDNERKGIIECPGINYLGCFYISVIILLFYRTLSAHYIYKYYQQSQLKAIISSIAQFLDISIFYEVYESHIHSSQTDNLSYLSKLEKTFESSLQLVLQMYVLMRELAQDTKISGITIISIIFSLVSLSTKVIADDQLAFTAEASKKHKPPFLFRAMFRMGEIAHRLLAITLFSTFFGANFLFIIFFPDLLTNVLLFDHGLLDSDPLNFMSYLLCTMNLGLIPTSKHQLISQAFMNRHPRFESFWDGLLMVMTRLEMITLCQLTTKNDHYLSYYLMRSKCIQSFFIFLVISVFALIDDKSSWHFDCFVCTDGGDRNSLYQTSEFLLFLVVGYVCCVVTYVTYSLSNVFHMKTGIILDRSPWVLFVNFNFFDSIRAFKERNGPNSFKIQFTLQRIIDVNARLPTLPRHKYNEDDIIATYPQLPYLIKEINDNLQPLSVLYELLENAIANLHDNFVDFFLNEYIVRHIAHYDPLSYLNPITNHNLLELAIDQQNNKMIQTVYLNCPQLLELDDYRMFYELWRGKYSSTIDCIIDYDFELIRKCNPMSGKSILFHCIDRKLYSILQLLSRRIEKHNFDTIRYKTFNVLFYTIKTNDIVALHMVGRNLDWNAMQLEVEYFDYHHCSQRYYVNPIGYAVLNGNAATLKNLFRYQGARNVINEEMRCVFEVHDQTNEQKEENTAVRNEKVMYLAPLFLAVSLHPKCTLEIMHILLSNGAITNPSTEIDWMNDLTSTWDQQVLEDLRLSLGNTPSNSVALHKKGDVLKDYIMAFDSTGDAAQTSAEKQKRKNTASMHLYVDKIIQTDNTKICDLLMNYFKLDPFRWKSANDTFIGLCTRYDSVRILRQLVESMDADKQSWIKQRDSARNSPFFEVKSVTACELLFELGFSIPAPRRRNTSLLYLMCTTGPTAHRASIVQWLLCHGARFVEESDPAAHYKVDMVQKRYPVLANACNYRVDLCECLAILIPLCDLNRRFHNNRDSLLHLAVLRCHVTTIRILLANGFDIDITNENGQTPLHLLCGPTPKYLCYKDLDLPNGSRINKMIHTLIHTLDADADMVDEEGNTPLHAAMTQTLHERVKILIDAGSDVNAQNKRMETPLHIACGQQDGNVAYRTHLIRKLLFVWNAEVDLTKKDCNGDTVVHVALQYASRKKRFDVRRLKLLAKAGADLNEPNKFGQSPLQIAFLRGRKRAFKALLAARCDTNGLLEWVMDMEETLNDKQLIKATESELRGRQNYHERAAWLENYGERTAEERKAKSGSKEFAFLIRKKFQFLLCTKYVDYFEDLLIYGCDFEADKKAEYTQKLETLEEWDLYAKLHKKYTMKPEDADDEEKAQMIRKVVAKLIAPAFDDYKSFELNVDELEDYLKEDLLDDEKDDKQSHLIKDYRPKTEDECTTIAVKEGCKDKKKMKEILDVYLSMIDNDDESAFVDVYFNDIIMSYVWDEEWLLLNNICSASQYEPILLHCFGHKDFKHKLDDIICKIRDDCNMNQSNLMVEALTFAYGVSYIQCKTREDSDDETDIQEVVEYIMKHTIYHKLNIHRGEASPLKTQMVHSVDLNEAKETIKEMETKIDKSQEYFLNLHAMGLRQYVIRKQMRRASYNEEDIDGFLHTLQDTEAFESQHNYTSMSSIGIQSEEDALIDYEDETLFVGSMHRDVTVLDPQTPMTHRAKNSKHEWVMFISTSKDKLIAPRSIQKVAYSLHESFKNNHVTVKKTPFYLRKVGWGAFDVGVEIVFKDDNKESIRMTHWLNFDVPVVITHTASDQKPYYPEDDSAFVTKEMEKNRVRSLKTKKGKSKSKK